MSEAPGTPIEAVINIGPVSAAELRSIGIPSGEALEELGWEEAYSRWVERFPERIHTMAAYALLGAAEGTNFLQLSDAQKARAKALVKSLRATMGPRR